MPTQEYNQKRKEYDPEQYDRETIAQLTSGNWISSWLWGEYGFVPDAVDCYTYPNFDYGPGEIDLRDTNHTEEICRGRFDIEDSELRVIQSHLSASKEDERMETRVLSLLNLPDNASESEVYQAVKELKDRLALTESKLIEIGVEKFMQENRERIADPEAFKRLCITHGKEVATAFLNVLK